MALTETLKKSFKVIKLSLTGVTGDAMLADSSGNTVFDLSEVNWSRIVMEVNATTVAGTNFTLKVVTANDSSLVNVSGRTATLANGTTTFVYTAITQALLAAKACSKAAADGSAASDMARFVGVFLDAAGTLTGCDGSVTLFIDGQ